MPKKAKPSDVPAETDPVCPVCLQPIKAKDLVHGRRDELIHESCDYARPADLPRSPFRP